MIFFDKFGPRANAEGLPSYLTKVINGIEYKAVAVEDKTYITRLCCKINICAEHW